MTRLGLRVRRKRVFEDAVVVHVSLRRAPPAPSRAACPRPPPPPRRTEEVPGTSSAMPKKFLELWRTFKTLPL